jgi:thiol-disulfide isomerase/thioredoxin
MKIKYFAALAASSLLGLATLAAQNTPPTKGDAKTELAALVTEVKGDLAQGQQTPEALAPELAKFDALLAEHKGEVTDDVAQIAFAKAALYLEIFHQPDQAYAQFKQLTQDFAGTATAQKVTDLLPQLAQAMAAASTKKTLPVGAAFPAFAVHDLDGKALSPDNYKGKILLVDFWATWCGPCMAEMPNVIKTYNKYHANGFEIIGVSLDQPDQKAMLTAFLAKNKMPWPQFYDGKYWQNELAVKYGIEEIPSNFLLDANGQIIGEDLRGDDLDAAVGKALATLSKPAAGS